MASPAAMLLIGAAKPKGKGAMMGGEKSEKDDPAKEGRVAAMRAFLKALKSDDAEAASEAAQLHYELCAESGHAESDEEDDSY